MKRLNNLYDKVTDPINLWRADEKAREHKTHTYGVMLHDKNRKQNLRNLYNLLIACEFHTSKYEVFKIYEPKEREIYRLPYYPDRIVHHAIMNVMEPIWTKIFTHNTFSCIKGRGINGCAKYTVKIMDKFPLNKPLYCLKIDVKKFYPNIDHDILKLIIRKKLKDKKLLALLDEIIDSAPGVPIGNYLSLYFSNLYMSYMMHEINSKHKIQCAEYADDIIFLHQSKDELRKFLNEFLIPYLRDKLHLELKLNYQIFPVAKSRHDKHGRAIDFVGFLFYRLHVLVRKSIKKAMCRKAHSVRDIKDTKEYKQLIGSWLGWCDYANARNLLKTIIPKEHEAILKRKARSFRKVSKCMVV